MLTTGPGERHMKRIILSAVVALACLSPAWAASSADKLQAGDTPPETLGATPDGDKVKVSDSRGTVTLVTFWASWCGPCRRELPVLDRLQRAAGSRVKVIAVNVKDTPKDYRFIRRQLEDTPITFTHDTRGVISDSYRVTAYPNLFVIGQDGKIAAVHLGFGEGSLDSLLEDVNALLLKAPAATPSAVLTPAG
jgi:thiol-disulfide isomerase/thioredoxin